MPRFRTPGGDAILRTLLPIYQEAAAKHPTDVEALTLLSDTCRDLGRKREALNVLQEAADLEPSNVNILLRCADLETDLGLKADALKDYFAARGLRAVPNTAMLALPLQCLSGDAAKSAVSSSGAAFGVVSNVSP